MKTSRSPTYHHAEHGKARLCATVLCVLMSSSNVLAASTPYSIEGHTIKKNGQTVFFVGDTVWTSGVRFHDWEMEDYLGDAKSKGFNLLGVFGTPVWAFRNGGNINGDPPFSMVIGNHFGEALAYADRAFGGARSGSAISMEERRLKR